MVISTLLAACWQRKGCYLHSRLDPGRRECQQHFTQLAVLIAGGDYRSNVIGCLNLADTCHSLGIHMTYYGTGCIFHYDEDFPMNSGKGFKESDKPNSTGSYYSYTEASCPCCSSCILLSEH